MKKDNIVAYLLLTVTSIIFGFSFMVTKDALEALGVFQLLGLRFLIAALVVTVLALTGAVKVKLTRSKLKMLLPLGLLEPLVYFVCETLGISLTSVSESGMMIALIPVTIALFSRIILKERLTVRQWVFVAVSFAGVVLVVATGGFSGSGNIAGYVLLLAAVTAAGLYNPLAKRALACCTPAEVTLMMMWSGAVVFNIIGVSGAVADGTISTYISKALQPDVLTGIMYLSILSSIVAYFGVTYALSKINASQTSGFSNLTTVVSVLAGVLIGGEPLYALQIAGMVLILISIWGIAGGATPYKKRLPENQAEPGEACCGECDAADITEVCAEEKDPCDIRDCADTGKPVC